jgi:hypothetical protein
VWVSVDVWTLAITVSPWSLISHEVAQVVSAGQPHDLGSHGWREKAHLFGKEKPVFKTLEIFMIYPKTRTLVFLKHESLL